MALLASFLFLGSQLLQIWERLPEIEISLAVWGGCAIAAVTYALILPLLALAWWQVLTILCPQDTPGLPEVLRVFMRAKIAKYLPGNIFHYVGRIELLTQSGITRMETGLSLTYETILLLAVALMLGGGPALSLGLAESSGLKHAMW